MRLSALQYTKFLCHVGYNALFITKDNLAEANVGCGAPKTCFHVTPEFLTYAEKGA